MNLVHAVDLVNSNVVKLLITKFARFIEHRFSQIDTDSFFDL